MEKSAKADVAAEVKEQELDDPKENKESNPTGLHIADENQTPPLLKKSIINGENGVSSADAAEVNSNNRIVTAEYRAGLVRHACLPARQVTDHATCEQLDDSKNIKVHNICKPNIKIFYTEFLFSQKHFAKNY